MSPENIEPHAGHHSPAKASSTGHPVFWLRPAGSIVTVDAVPGETARAIVSEVVACATRFVDTGEVATIDLRFLKSMAAERETLAALLGKGEVTAAVDSLGRTEVQETSIPCVWWIRHRDSEGEIVGEFIEIADVPDLLVGDPEAVAQGLEALSAAEPFSARGESIASPFPNTR
jgi:hydrogenase-1 operon protein HyaF